MITTTKARYAPVYIDYYQSDTYRLVAYTVTKDGAVFAHFADGHVKPSIYQTEQALCAAGDTDYRERVACTWTMNTVY